MKKLLAILLMLVMAVGVLAGCSDPVYDDLENFLNVEMTEVNADYEALKAELGKWESFEDDAALLVNINEALLPIVDGSLAKLKEINPATEEVKALKDKYVKVMEAYKEGFTALAKGCETQEDADIEAGNAGIEKALQLLDEYNKGLEELAKEHGAEIEY